MKEIVLKDSIDLEFYFLPSPVDSILDATLTVSPTKFVKKKF